MALFGFVRIRFWMGKIGFVVGFGPGGAACPIPPRFDPIWIWSHGIFAKRTALGLSHGCCFGGGVKQVIIVLHK